MNTSQNIKSFSDDEVSIADIIQFFQTHKKFISYCIILGGLFGAIFGNFKEPIYNGSGLISPAKISGAYVENPKNLLANLNLNSFYSKNTLLKCNPEPNKNYNISSIVQYSIKKDTELIELQMQHKNKTFINDCLNSVINDISVSQNLIANPLIELKKNELIQIEKKLIASEEFKKKLNDNQVKKHKIDSLDSIQELIYINMLISNDFHIEQYINEINKRKVELASKQTKPLDLYLPIDFKKKSFSPELCAAIGLFLGLCIGIIIALIKKIKV